MTGTTTGSEPAAQQHPTADPGGVWALLQDGRLARIRPLDRGDWQTVTGLFAEMSPQNRYLRFFGIRRDDTGSAADRICQPPSRQHLALGAFVGPSLTGVARFAAVQSGTAEVAFAVTDQMHHLGIATLLVEHLAGQARDRGMRQFTAEVLVHDANMLRVFQDAGLATHWHRDADTIEVSIDPTPDEQFVDAAVQRDAEAQVASLRHLFRPESVLVIDAGGGPASVGDAVIANLRAAGYRGMLAVVPPRNDPVQGVSGYPRIDELPFQPELAVMAVPEAALTEAVDGCSRAGVRAVVVLTAGLSPDAATALLERCRGYGMRLVGPNCLGIANPAEGLDATLVTGSWLAGGAGLAVQSGDTGVALAGQLSRLGIGVSTFASLGDKDDVSATDLLQWWQADQVTGQALLYVESFGNPRRFARVARQVGRRVPVLVVTSGRGVPTRSAAASYPAASYPAAVETSTANRQALFEQAGVIAIADPGDLISTSTLLAWQPLPTGNGVAILSNAGAAGVLAADACVNAGLQVPALAASTQSALAALLPAGAAVGNPVDATTLVDPAMLVEATQVLAADPAVHAVLVLPVPTAQSTLDALDWDYPSVPLVVVRLDQPERVRLEPTRTGGQVPIYGAPRDAAVALGRVTQYAGWRRAPRQRPVTMSGAPLRAVRRLVTNYLAKQPDGGWLSPIQAARLVEIAGVPVLPLRVASSARSAVAAAREIGFPVAVKAVGNSPVHTRQAHAMVPRLADGPAVDRAYRWLTDWLGEAMSGVIVQPMAPADLELLVRAYGDPVFGPVVSFGRGGVMADAVEDRLVRLAPLTTADAAETVAGVRVAATYGYAAGGDPIDVLAVREVLLRVAALAEAVPELIELDLDPLLATGSGVTVPDVQVRLGAVAGW